MKIKILNCELVKEEDLDKSKFGNRFEIWYKINGVDYYFKFRESIYHLVNELINKSLNKMCSIKSVDFKMVKFSDLKILKRLSTYKDEDYNYCIISKNFMKDNTTYYYANEIIDKISSFSFTENVNRLKSNCVDNENFRELKNDLVQLLIKDFFVKVADRWDFKNTIFERENFLNSPLLLSENFDNEISFMKSYFYDNNIGGSCYGTVKFPSIELNNLLAESIKAIELVKFFLSLNANKFFDSFQINNSLQFDDYILSEYVEFIEQRQEILMRCLR